uniref:Uncharacterized protein n=1 Tax=Tetraselmis chuii TaxID=63592 RepID=A0A7S1SXX9_9CHLO|mmetsp:Transcript_34303/g.61220  ORF Transcript_34303/g.61220 Transcript_34303/m.61220 type:complete len:291 (+) Transcript_34303:267-1139(+)
MSRHAVLCSALLLSVLATDVSATTRDVIGATPRLKNKAVRWTGDEHHRVLKLDRAKSQSLPANGSALLQPMYSDRCDDATAPSLFTRNGPSQLFATGTYDLGGKRLRFCADAATICQNVAGRPSYSISGGTDLPLADDDLSAATPFTGTFSFPFFGTSYTSMEVSNNGFIRLGTGNTAAATPSLASHTGNTQISGAWVDYDATTGDVNWRQIGNSVVVISWNGLTVKGLGVVGSSQIALHADGVVEIWTSTSLNAVAAPALVGISNAMVTTSQTDLSAAQQCLFYRHLEF